MAPLLIIDIVDRSGAWLTVGVSVASSLVQPRSFAVRQLRHPETVQPADVSDSSEDAMSGEPRPEDAMSGESRPEDDYSIRLPATESLPARSGGLLQTDVADGLADDIRAVADGLAERAVKAAADLTAGLVPVSADVEQVARDLTSVAGDVDRVLEDVEVAVSDVKKAVADVSRTAQDLEKVELQLERDFLDGSDGR